MVNLDRSVNCYFCADLVDERHCIPADKYNGEDGGSICRPCVENKEKATHSYHEKLKGTPRDTFWNILMPAVQEATGLSGSDCAGLIQEAYLQWHRDLGDLFGFEERGDEDGT